MRVKLRLKGTLRKVEIGGKFAKLLEGLGNARFAGVFRTVALAATFRKGEIAGQFRKKKVEIWYVDRWCVAYTIRKVTIVAFLGKPVSSVYFGSIAGQFKKRGVALENLKKPPDERCFTLKLFWNPPMTISQMASKIWLGMSIVTGPMKKCQRLVPEIEPQVGHFDLTIWAILGLVC